MKTMIREVLVKCPVKYLIRCCKLQTYARAGSLLVYEGNRLISHGMDADSIGTVKKRLDHYHEGYSSFRHWNCDLKFTGADVCMLTCSQFHMISLTQW